MPNDSELIQSSGWSDKENDLIVLNYLEMLRLELSGQNYVKSQRNVELQKITGRSRGSIEFKYMNISAALESLGLPRISGYAPMRNLQRSLVDAIERNYGSIVSVAGALEEPENQGFSEIQELPLVDVPPLPFDEPFSIEKNIERLVRKFDPAERDARNRLLGRRGEQLVVQNERARLLRTNSRLAERVRWVSEEQGDGAGYDILSFEADGRERLLEVKTTIGGQTTPFYLSRNELAFSEERRDAFRLVRVFDFSKSPKAFELIPPLNDLVRLQPSGYTASFY